MSRLAVCLGAAHRFHLSDCEAQNIVDRQVTGIREHWKEICDEACLTESDRAFLWERQFLNPYAFS